MQRPPTEYGYWIDPKGGVHVVNEFEGHELFFETADDPSYPRTSGDAITTGWIRVVDNDWDSLEFQTRGEASLNAAKTLLRLVADDRRGYYVYDDFKARVHLRTSDRSEAVKAIRKAVGL
jgi:hypothetical protein